MSRTPLENALRFQQRLSNNAACLTCVLQQSLICQDKNTKSSFLCLNCHEVIVLAENAPLVCPFCNKSQLEKLS